MTHPIYELLKKRILILDGAMGTMIESEPADTKDYKGAHIANALPHPRFCHEVLNLTRPQLIAQIHTAYLEAGADIISTNTINANAASLCHFDLHKATYKINCEAARIARNSALPFSTKEKPRFVAGAIGPPSQKKGHSPALSAQSISCSTNIYEEQVKGLMDGGVDFFLIETITSIADALAALSAVSDLYQKTNTFIPVMVSAAIDENTGKLFSGEALRELYESLPHEYLLSFGLNCFTSIEKITPLIKKISAFSTHPISLYPNAGMPDKDKVYPIDAESLFQEMAPLLQKKQINIVGSCCGSTPKLTQRFYTFLNSIIHKK